MEMASAEAFAEVRAPAALEGVEMWMTVFLARLAGAPTPAAEIAALRWWPAEPAPRLAPAIRDCVIPRLRRAGRLEAASTAASIASAPRARATDTRWWPSRTAYESPTRTTEIGGSTAPRYSATHSRCQRERAPGAGRKSPSNSFTRLGSTVPAIASSGISRTALRPARGSDRSS